METVRIGILVNDRAYRNALFRGLSHESRDFQFIALSDADDEALIRSCQIVLVDTFYMESDDRLGSELSESADPVIWLTYHESYDLGNRSSRMEIFRYEDARVFVNKIIYYYARAKGIDLYFHGKRKCRKVVFSDRKSVV